MPAGHHDEDTFFNGIKVDKENDTSFFNDETHTYYNKKNMRKYISCTTIVHEYCQPFDGDFWSSYKAFEAILDPEVWQPLKVTLLQTKKVDPRIINKLNIDEQLFAAKKQEILDSYKKNSEEACIKGTLAHEKKEFSFYNRDKFDFGRYGYKDLAGDFTCKKDYYKLDLVNGVYPEFLIQWESEDGELMIAGISDLVVVQGKDLYIIDWKGLPLDTPIATKEGFKAMKDLQVGDQVFDKDGKLCTVTVKSEVHNNPCYTMYFNDAVRRTCPECITADKDHRWLVTIGKKERIMTTEELYNHINTHKLTSYNTPRIRNVAPIDLPAQELPIDPYVLGAWLGDGDASDGRMTQASGSPLWKELERRGFELGPDQVKRKDTTEARTVFGLRALLRENNLLNNKHIPDIYLRGSFEQRLDLLRGLMDTDGSYHPKRDEFTMQTAFLWQAEGMEKLLGTLGIQTHIIPVTKTCEGKSFPAYSITFRTADIAPFLTRNIGIKCKKSREWRLINKIDKTDTIPTQCIQVDSPSHTYCFGHNMIVTHNTSKKIDKKSYYNKATKQSVKMRYPLNNLDDCNFNTYQLQLSLYAWMIQQQRPDLEVKGLMIIKLNDDGSEEQFPCNYLKDEIERMIKHYQKQQRVAAELNRVTFDLNNE